MRKLILSPCFVSKGYNSDEPLRFSQDGSMVQFRVGVKVYDKRAADNTRWININVKAFGAARDRVKSMQLKAGSMIALDGKFDIDTWEDAETKDKKSAPVIILDDIEYAGSNGGGKKQASSDGSGTATSEPQNASPQPESGTPEQQPEQGSFPENMENFTGYESFGGPNPFFPQG